jgi:hypothetical protein
LRRRLVSGLGDISYLDMNLVKMLKKLVTTAAQQTERCRMVESFKDTDLREINLIHKSNSESGALVGKQKLFSFLLGPIHLI